MGRRRFLSKRPGIVTVLLLSFTLINLLYIVNGEVKNLWWNVTTSAVGHWGDGMHTNRYNRDNRPFLTSASPLWTGKTANPGYLISENPSATDASSALLVSNLEASDQVST
jgi:hypothetical protein